MTFTFRLVTLVSCVVLCTRGQIAGPNQREFVNDLRLQVIDVFGNPLSYFVGSFTPALDSGLELAGQFRGTLVQGILPGGYAYLLQPQGPHSDYEELKGRVRVHGRFQVLTLIARLKIPPSVTYREGCLYPGKITPPPSSKDGNWIRVTGLYGDLGADEFMIGSDGLFCLYGHREGAYVLSVFTSGRLAALQPITISGSNRGPIEVHLAPGKAASTPVVKP